MKVKDLLIALSALFFVFISCNNDDDGSGNFDAAAQALIDDEDLIEYLKTHHYIPPAGNEVFGVIDTIDTGETFTPLFDNVITTNITDNDEN